MSLGEAFIDIRANTDEFKNELMAKLKAVLKEAQAQADKQPVQLRLSTRLAEDALRKFRKEAARGVSMQLKLDVSQAIRAVADVRAAVAAARAEANRPFVIKADVSHFNQAVQNAAASLASLRAAGGATVVASSGVAAGAPAAAAGSFGAVTAAETAAAAAAAAFGAAAATATVEASTGFADVAVSAVAASLAIDGITTNVGDLKGGPVRDLGRLQIALDQVDFAAGNAAGQVELIGKRVEELGHKSSGATDTALMLEALGDKAGQAERAIAALAKRGKTVTLSPGTVAGETAVIGRLVDGVHSLDIAAEHAGETIAKLGGGGNGRPPIDLRNIASGADDAARGIDDVVDSAGGLFNAAQKAGGSVEKLTGGLGKLSLRNPYVLGPLAVAAAVAAIGVAAEGSALGIAALGVSSSEATRAVKLQLTDANLAGQDLADTLAGIRRLGETGLGLTAASTGTVALLHAGESAKTALATVKAVGDAVAGSTGLVGKALATAVTKSVASLVDLSKQSGITRDAVSDALAPLGLPTKTSDVIKQLAVDLRHAGESADDAQKRVAKLLAPGGKGVNGAVLGQAALEVAGRAPNSKNGLDAAAASSFVQATQAAIQKTRDGLSDLFSSPALVAQVTKFGDKVSKALVAFGPQAVQTFSQALTAIGGAITPVAGFLQSVSTDISKVITKLSSPGSVSFFDNLGHALKEVGRIAVEILGPSVKLAIDTVKKLGPAFGDIAKIGKSLEPIARLVGVVLAGAFEATAGKVSLVIAALHKVTPAITAIFNALSSVVEFVTDKLADLLGLLSKILGVKIFGHGIPGASEVQSQLDGIISGLRTIDGSTATATVNIITNGNSLTGGLSGDRQRSLTDAGTSDPLQAAADALSKRLKAKAKAPDFSGAADTSAADAAKSAAKTAADAIKAARKTLSDALKSLSKELTGADVATVRSTLSTLKVDIKGAFSGKVETSLLKSLSAARGTLVTEAKLLAKTEKQIVDANAAIAASVDNSRGFGALSTIASALNLVGNAATNATTKLADLSRLHIITANSPALTNIVTPGSPGEAAAQLSDLQKNLDSRVSALAAFQKSVADLAKRGLNAGSVQDLLTSGVDQSGNLASILDKASTAQLAAINSSESALRAAADATAKIAGDAQIASASKIGGAVADGVLAGIKAKDKELKAAMVGLADALVSELRRALKVHSPSKRVHDEVGVHIGSALVKAIDGSHPAIRAAMGRAGDAIAGYEMPSIGQLSAAGTAQAQRQLTAALSVSTTNRMHPDDIRALGAVIAANPGKTYHVPVNQVFHGAKADPGDQLARVIRGLR